MTTFTNNQNEQLFTDLTPEEAAVVEGGAVLLQRLHAVRLTPDDGRGPDEIHIRKDGQKLNWVPMSKGQIRKLGTKGRGLRASSISAVSLQEYDRGPGNDEFLSLVSTTSHGNGRLATFKGGGALYRLAYKYV